MPPFKPLPRIIIVDLGLGTAHLSIVFKKTSQTRYGVTLAILWLAALYHSV